MKCYTHRNISTCLSRTLSSLVSEYRTMRLALQHLPKIILAIILIIMITKPFQRRLLQAQVQVQASPLGTPILGQGQTRTCHCHINMLYQYDDADDDSNDNGQSAKHNKEDFCDDNDDVPTLRDNLPNLLCPSNLASPFGSSLSAPQILLLSPQMRHRVKLFSRSWGERQSQHLMK